jgi:hypothetical protein
MSNVSDVRVSYGPDGSERITRKTVMARTPPAMFNSLFRGGAVLENKEKATRVSPTTYVTSDDPPFLIVHGDKDPIVPFNQSQLLFEALKKSGVSAVLPSVELSPSAAVGSGKRVEPECVYDCTAGEAPAEPLEGRRNRVAMRRSLTHPSRDESP